VTVTSRIGREMKRFIELSGYSKFTVNRICKEYGINHRTATDEQIREATAKWMSRERKTLRNARLVTVNGVSLTLSKWAKITGIKLSSLDYRARSCGDAVVAVTESLAESGRWRQGRVIRSDDSRVRKYVFMGREISRAELAALSGFKRDTITGAVRRKGEEAGIRHVLESSGKMEQFLLRAKTKEKKHADLRG